MKKAILFIGGGLEAVPGIERAKEMGYHVLVSDGSPSAPGMKHAHHFFHADTYDGRQTSELILHYHASVRPVSGVICLAADVPSTVAAVAERLSIPSISSASARLCTHKLEMKDRLKRHGVPIPWYTPVDSYREVEALQSARGQKLVLKPVDSRGARGVFLIDECVDVKPLFEKSIMHSPSGQCMVEAYLDGPQISTESLFVDRKLYTPGFSDRNYDRLELDAPHIIEDGGQLPSFMFSRHYAEVHKTVERAANGLGVDFGVVKGDIVIHDEKPYVIELAARLSGGYFCSHEIPLNTGVDFIAAAIRIAVGDPVVPEDLQPRFQKGVAQRFLFPDPGIVTSISGVEEVASWDSVKLCEIRVAPGDKVYPVESHVERAGVVITQAESREEAVEIAERAVRKIDIKTSL